MAQAVAITSRPASQTYRILWIAGDRRRPIREIL